MGSSRLFGIMAMLLVVLLPMAVKGNIFDGFFGNVCAQVECGKGSCVANKSYPFNYVCECESGWKQTQYYDDKYATGFLPCVIPKCTMNLSCLPALAPVPFPGKSFPFPPSLLPSSEAQAPVSKKKFPFLPNITTPDQPPFLRKGFPFLPKVPSVAQAPLSRKGFPFLPKVPSVAQAPLSRKGFPFLPKVPSVAQAPLSRKGFPFLPKVPSFAQAPLSRKGFPFPPNASPMKGFPFPPNASPIFDPCNWASCGEGTCVKSKTFTYSCQCSKGHYNLLNNTAFPCYSSECVFGSDCAKVGIKVGSSTIN